MALSKLTDIRKSLSIEIEDLQVNGITTFTGNISIGGTLTYQDVTNVDSVGVITARSGIRLGATASNTLQNRITGNSTGIAIGATTPASVFHVADTNSTVWPFSTPVPDTYAFTPYPHELYIKNDVVDTQGSFAGIYFRAGAHTNNGRVSTARIAAVDSGDYKADLVFANRGYASGGGGYDDFRENLRIKSDGKIGISTTTPSTLLQIVGSTASTDSSGGTLGIRQKGDTHTDGITLTSSHANSARFWKDSDGALHIYNTGGLQNDFVQSNDGKIGINTNNPTKKLHIRSTANADGIVIKSHGSTYNEISFDANRDSNTNHIGRILANWNGGVVAYMSLDTGLDTSNKDDGQIRFFTSKESNSALERLRINHDGKLIQNFAAIGTYPSNLPPVYFAGEKQNYGGLEVTMNLHDDSSDAIGNGGGVSMSANNGTTIIARGGIKGHAEATGSNAGSLIFYTRPASGILSEKMRIDSAGRITKPLQPVFYAQITTSAYTLTTTETALVYDTARINVGSHYNTSNGRFTAPIDGLYEFGYAAIGANTADVYRYTLRVNGSNIYTTKPQLRVDTSQSQSQYGTNGEFVVYVNMTAGQYAQVYAKADGGNNGFSNNSTGYTYFRGRLIG